MYGRLPATHAKMDKLYFTVIFVISVQSKIRPILALTIVPSHHRKTYVFADGCKNMFIYIHICLLTMLSMFAVHPIWFQDSNF